MNVADLIPLPAGRDAFRRSRERFVPDRAGCYVITTFEGIILYIGLTVSLRRRMNDHLDTPAKVTATALGRGVWFHWLETRDTNMLERTWLNMHLNAEGKLPPLNHLYSPTMV